MREVRGLRGGFPRTTSAALVHDDRFVAAIRETTQEIWSELTDMWVARTQAEGKVKRLAAFLETLIDINKTSDPGVGPD